jgi:6-phosphofructokinase 1
MNGLVLQCGGPTAVLNTTLSATVARWQQQPGHGRLFGARLGLQGLVRGDWVDLTDLPAAVLARLAEQPGAALGSGRYRLDDRETPAVLRHLSECGVGITLFIGGNGTMGAAQRIQQAADAAGVPLRTVGAPKTIDNDLAGTDVAPGYPSAARFVAQTVRDVALDLHAMSNFDDVTVVEVMGRHTGWLAAAAALARGGAGAPPHLILLPEVPVDEGALVAEIARVQQQGNCLLVAAEGVRDRGDTFLAEKESPAVRDARGQRVLSYSPGVAARVARLVQGELGLRCRQVRLDVAQRTNSSLAAPLDRALAAQVGAAAVAAAFAGASGVMLGLARHESPRGGWATQPVPFAAVAGHERPLPAHFIAPRFNVTQSCVDALSSLVAPLPGPLLLW